MVCDESVRRKPCQIEAWIKLQNHPCAQIPYGQPHVESVPTEPGCQGQATNRGSRTKNGQHIRCDFEIAGLGFSKRQSPGIGQRSMQHRPGCALSMREPTATPRLVGRARPIVENFASCRVTQRFFKMTETE